MRIEHLQTLLRSARWPRFITGCVLLITGLIAFSWALSLREPGKLTPKAVLLDQRYDFGIVKRGEKIVHRFHLRNEGSAPLNLQRAELTVPGMKVSYRKVMAPGNEGTVIVEWNTEHVNGKQEARILLYCDDASQHQLQMLLEGSVQPPIEFQPYPAVFLSLFQGESGERSVQILNHEDRPLRILKLEPSADYFTPVLRTVSEGKEYQLTVKVGPNAPAGRHQDLVSIRTDDAASPELRVLVNVLVKTDVYVNPERLDFGEVSLEQLRLDPSRSDFVSETFMVKKRAGTLMISSITSDLDALTIRRDPEGTSGSFQVDVKLVPAILHPGELRGTIRIHTSDRAFPEFLVPVSASIR